MKTAIWKQLPGSSSSHGGTLLLLFNVLNHIVIWQKVRWVSNALIKSVQFYPSPLQRVSFHVSMSVCRALPDARTLSEWHSDTSTVRDSQRADSQAARPDIRMLLRSRSHPRGMHRWGCNTSLLEPFCALKVLCTVRLNETAVSLDYKEAASTFLCLSIAWISNIYIFHWIMLTLTFSYMYHISSLADKTKILGQTEVIPFWLKDPIKWALKG